MKSKFLIIVSFFAVSFFVFAEQMVYIYKKDGTKVPYVAATLDSIGFVNATSGNENGHEWVDLGLPSGTKWATCNVGAESPEDYGDYFAWGETEPKSSYYESNYTYSINPTELPLDKDAAHVNWGGDWRMPTKAEQDELWEKCTWVRGTMNGVEGYTVTGHNGKSIFLPTTGYRYNYDLEQEGATGYYWSSSIKPNDYSSAYYLRFGSNDLYRDRRYFGLSVRPVLRE